MINESTINKLIEMHLTAMADAFRIQLHIPFELHADSDCICMTVSDGTAYLSV